MIKLRRICVQAAVLSNRSELERFAPVVCDLHPGCGPMSGLEAALVHAHHDWTLVLPVDVPFVPTAMLYSWAQSALRHGQDVGTRVALFRVQGIPQPTLVMLHRDLAPYLTVALAQERFRLFPELVAATQDLAARREQDPVHVLQQWVWSEESRFTAGGCEPPGPPWTATTPEQEAGTALFFANLNTPEDFAQAEQRAQVLDT